MRRARVTAAVAALLITVSILMATGCAKQEPGGEGELRVGVILPLTGPITAYGEECKHGIELAIEEINERGKVKIRPIYEDGKGVPSDSKKALEKLLSVGGAKCIIGPVTSQPAMTVANTLDLHKVPVITPTGTNVDITRKSRYMFRVCFTDPFQGYVMARFAREQLGAQTAVIMVNADSDYSQGLARSFRETFEKGGGEVKEVISYRDEDKDFNPLLTKVQQANPDCVFVPHYYGTVGPILNQAETKGLKMPFLGGDGWDSPKLYELAGAEAAAGNYFSSHFSPEADDPQVRRFVAKYEKRFGGKPGAMAALGYDAALVLEDACIRAGEVTPEKIRQAISATKNFKGVTGVITLDENRDARKPAVIMATKGDRAVFKSVVEPGEVKGGGPARK